MPTKNVYWDASVFHALFGEEIGRVQFCKAVIDAASRGTVNIYTSTVSFVECVWIKGHPDRLSPIHEKEMQRFFKHEFLLPINCDRRIVESARMLLWTYPHLKPKDAIHVASAISQPIDVLHTYDDKDLVVLSDIFGTPPLKICHPGDEEKNFKLVSAPPPPLQLPPGTSTS
jgi:predicted nucleic acid-binding protein